MLLHLNKGKGCSYTAPVYNNYPRSCNGVDVYNYSTVYM